MAKHDFLKFFNTTNLIFHFNWSLLTINWNEIFLFISETYILNIYQLLRYLHIYIQKCALYIHIQLHIDLVKLIFHSTYRINVSHMMTFDLKTVISFVRWHLTFRVNLRDKQIYYLASLRFYMHAKRKNGRFPARHKREKSQLKNGFANDEKQFEIINYLLIIYV